MELNDDNGIVLYVDGVAKLKTGFGGHGYRYTKHPSKQGSGLPSIFITDVGYVRQCDFNLYSTSPVKVTPLEYMDFYGYRNSKGNNIAAELESVLEALKLARGTDSKTIKIINVRESVRKGFKTYLPVWKENNWKKSNGDPIANGDLWQSLETLFKEMTGEGRLVDIEYSLGHSALGETTAKVLAKLAANYASDTPSDAEPLLKINTAPAKGYWSKKPEKHPFLAHKKMFFNNNKKHITPGRYYTTEPSNDPFVYGMKLANASYAIILLNKPDKALEAVREAQCNASTGMDAIAVANLEKVFSRETYDVLSVHGDNCLSKYKRNNTSLCFLDDEAVTEEINPPGLSLRAVDNFAFISAVFSKYLEERGYKTAGITIPITTMDITDRFFTTEEVTKGTKKSLITTLNKAIDESDGTMNVELNGDGFSRIVPIVLGLDTLPRNQLKKLETMSPKVEVVYWRDSAETIRYGTVINAGGSVGIWVGYYSNSIYLNNHD